MIISLFLVMFRASFDLISTFAILAMRSSWFDAIHPSRDVNLYLSLEQDLLILLVGFHNLVFVPLLGQLRSYILGKYLASVSFSGFSRLATKYVSVAMMNTRINATGFKSLWGNYWNITRVI